MEHFVSEMLSMIRFIQSVELWLCRICHSFKDLFQRNLMMLIDKHNHRHSVILTQGSIFSFRKCSGIAPGQSNEVLLVFHFYLSGRIVVVLFRYWNFHVFNNTLNYLFPILRNRQAFKAANICRLMPRFMFFLYSNSIFFRSYALKSNYFCYLCRSNCRLSYRRI